MQDKYKNTEEIQDKYTRGGDGHPPLPRDQPPTNQLQIKIQNTNTRHDTNTRRMQDKYKNTEEVQDKYTRGGDGDPLLPHQL